MLLYLIDARKINEDRVLLPLPFLLPILGDSATIHFLENLRLICESAPISHTERVGLGLKSESYF